MDLFSTIGKVDRAEIQYEPNGRSRGTGVVQFDSPETGETAIGGFFFLYPSGLCMVTNKIQPNSRATSTAVVHWASRLSST